MALPQIDIAINLPSWGSHETLLKLIEPALLQTSTAADLKWQEGAELSFLFSGDAEVKSINAKWRNIDKPTNVLSFPGEEIEIGDAAGLIIGDIIFAFETIEREALEQDTKFEDHLTHLVVHGFLHLFGYDHIRDKDANQMEALETKILAKLGIEDPYKSLD